MPRKPFSLVVLLFLPILAAAQTATSPDPWSGWQFLIGTFDSGQSSGVPGAASGGAFTLAPELNGTILVRKSYADYPAAKDHPAFSHSDLMVVYHEGGAARALYTDSEGHIIHYAVTLSAHGSQIVFLSENTSGPRFRLTYDDRGTGAVHLLFEIAPPAPSGQFARYVEATVHRKNP